MTPIIQPASSNHVLVRLSKDEMTNPIKPIEDLCDEYTIGEVRIQLRELVERALIDEEYNTPKRREDLIEWHKKTEKSPEAAYSIVSLLQPEKIFF